MSAVYEKLLASKKYRDVCPDTLRRVAEDCEARYAKLKDAEKAAKEALHGITGAFLGAEDLKRARSCLMSGDLEGALRLHASTRERMPLDAFYDALFARTGRPASVLDIACGLNPAYLGVIGVPVTGIDIAGAQIDLLNDWAAETGAPVRCFTRDALCENALPEGRFDLALVMKLLPVLENEKKGAAADLLREIDARIIAATFPTRTLTGRGIGMEKHYSEWFEAILPEELRVLDRYVCNDELIYLVGREETNGETVCGGDAHRKSE